MAKAVTLYDSTSTEVYPVTSLALAVGSIATAKIDDGAVTAAKIDFSTIGALNYSTSEVATGGTWVDGKPIYKKTINFGALPNAANKAVAHGISNLNRVIRMEAIADYGTGNTKFPIPFSSSAGLGSSVSLVIESSTIEIRTGIDRSGATAYVTIYYTKR